MKYKEEKNMHFDWRKEGVNLNAEHPCDFVILVTSLAVWSSHVVIVKIRQLRYGRRGVYVTFPVREDLYLQKSKAAGF